MARRSKYTDEVVERICAAITLGATYELAAQSAGISYETLRTWRERKPAFAAALEKAEGEAVVHWLAQIEAVAESGNWQAAAWRLERRYPKHYGRNADIIERLEQLEERVKQANPQPLRRVG